MNEIQPWIWGSNLGLQERGHALFLTEGQVLEADNLCWLNECALQMRPGSETQSLTGSTFTGEIQWLQSFLPADNGAEQLWAAANNSGTAVFARRVSGTWSTVSFPDTPVVVDLRYLHSAALNGKLFLAYNSAVNRLHVWDGTNVRRVGQSVPSAPTVANTGAGAYAATARRYRVATRIKSGTTIHSQSELSDATSFTPSGAGTAARVSRPVTYESSATHWVVYGLIGTSGDTYDLYEELSEIAIGTGTYDDSTAPSAYDGDFPPELGINVPPPSAKFLVSDGSRLLMAGAWETSAGSGETAPKVNRVWFSRVLGETDAGDDEAIPAALTQSNYADVGDAAAITGIAGPLYGQIYVFKGRSVYKLVPTGDAVSPYAVVQVSETCGAVHQRVITLAVNATGSPSIHFADEHALYSISDGGLSPLGTPIVRDTRANATLSDQSLLIYDPYQQQVLFQIAVAPNTVSGSYKAFIGDVLKQRWGGFSLGGASGGWTLGVDALGTGTVLAGGGSTIVAATVAGVASTTTRRLLVGGQNASAAASLTAVGVAIGLDGTSTYTAKARARKVLKPGFRFSAFNPTIYYRNPQGVTAGTLTATIALLRPAGPSGESTTVTESVTLTPTTDESGIEVQEHTFTGVQWDDISVLDVRLTMSYTGTAFASAVPPTIDACVIPLKVGGPLSR